MSKFFPLKERLESRGWEISSVELSEAWWALEIWELKSLWRPIGVSIFLTLELDLMDGDNSRRPQESDVWKVGLDFELNAGCRRRPSGEFFLKRRFNTAIEEISQKADDMRVALTVDGE